ncbi:uncharacterized protein LOC117640573 isoform X2 [Thrips palmi]|uniref:Uncharacterized protein LOC117640573 isoform X2 n=1 Tax=Thrips palmi TaxID=161013 RepID=A0A6P8YA22_THRPL|nr:uncharacterized protein LOC117640573 isoform X2 [Thrips palmi]
MRAFEGTAHMRMDIRANNEWKNGAFVLKFPKIGCSMFRANVPSLFKAVYKGVSMTGACSAPPGVYVFDDPVDWAFPNIHVFPYGHYYLTLNTGQRDSKNASLCSHVELRFIPKSVV